MLTKNKIESLYRQAVLRLDNQWDYLRQEFGEEAACKVYQQKLDKIIETYQLRLLVNTNRH